MYKIGSHTQLKQQKKKKTNAANFICNHH